MTNLALPTYDDVAAAAAAHRRARPPHPGPYAPAPPTRSSAPRSSSSARTCSAWAPSSSAAPTTRCRGSTPRSAAPASSRTPRATTRRRSRSRPGSWASRRRSSCPSTRRPRRSPPRSGYGAEVVSYDRYHRRPRADRPATLADAHGLTLIPPYDHADVIAGQGTAAKELFEEVGALDAALRLPRRRRPSRRIRPVGAGAVAGLQALRRRAGSGQRRPALAPQRRDRAHRDAQDDRRRRPDAAPRHSHVPDHPARGRRHPDRKRRAARRGDALLRDAHEARRRADRLPRLRRRAGDEGERLRGQRVGVLISGGNVDLDRFAALLAA